jgi:hypothetical protein
MSAIEILEQIRQLPEAARRDLVERIEGEFGMFENESGAELAELDRRAKEALAHPRQGRPMKDVMAELGKRLREAR